MHECVEVCTCVFLDMFINNEIWLYFYLMHYSVVPIYVIYKT